MTLHGKFVINDANYSSISLFIVSMLLVANYIPYDGFVDYFIMQHIIFADAERIGKVVLDELDTESYESVRDYFNTLINILISVPLLCILTTAFDANTWKTKPTVLLKKWALPTIRRFTKLFAFGFLFWALFRFLPYQHIFPNAQIYSSFTITAVIVFNLLITIVCYGFITKKIAIKRSF
ncbi:hypothetical protein ID854_20540 [Xenorhabdus sp. M]|uniref:Uncharacterized protein n=1 Tax=Xenorhabdus szentirmaii TaxID=290112 RepID=A0AAW3YX93_9GAMM|nr:hypothetical protein [Xenorhabdus sp. M]MBD2802763.1 hypothetical protein [Xenorhabdus sp. M]